MINVIDQEIAERIKKVAKNPQSPCYDEKLGYDLNAAILEWFAADKEIIEREKAKNAATSPV